MDASELMQPGGGDWTDEAACIGDDRFLHPAKTEGLKLICDRCDVKPECDRWARGRSGIFAAGYWREDEELEPWHGIATGSNP